MNSDTCACRTGTFDSCPDHPPRDTCPVCLHPAEMHQPDGCWFTMAIARPNSVSGCPCGVRRETDTEPNRAPFLVRQLDATKAVLGYREQELLTLKGPCSVPDCRLHYAHSGPCDVATTKEA